jgi:hypothetical protein
MQNKCVEIGACGAARQKSKNNRQQALDSCGVMLYIKRSQTRTECLRPKRGRKKAGEMKKTLDFGREKE